VAQHFLKQQGKKNEKLLQIEAEAEQQESDRAKTPPTDLQKMFNSERAKTPPTEERAVSPSMRSKKMKRRGSIFEDTPTENSVKAPRPKVVKKKRKNTKNGNFALPRHIITLTVYTPALNGGHHHRRICYLYVNSM
jgi:hypothetical protein